MTKASSNKFTDGNIPDPVDSDPETMVQESAEVTGEVFDPADDVSEDEAGSATSSESGALEAQQERYLRLAAEYDNYRKRTGREMMQAAGRGQADLIKGLLDSLDDLQRFAGVDSATTDSKSLIDGVALVERNIMKTLSNAGLEVIDPLELPFDPNMHEALSTQAAETPEEDHMVAQVYQRGFMLGGQLLRPARVVVKQYQ